MSLEIVLQIIGALSVARYMWRHLKALFLAKEKKNRDWYEKPIFKEDEL